LDLAHLEKVARVKIVNHPVCIDSRCSQIHFTAVEIDCFLRLGDVLSNSNSISQIQELCVVRFFTMETHQNALRTRNQLLRSTCSHIYWRLWPCERDLFQTDNPFIMQCSHSHCDLFYSRFLTCLMWRQSEVIEVRPWRPFFHHLSLLSCNHSYVGWSLSIAIFICQAWNLVIICGEHFGAHTFENFTGLIPRACHQYDSLDNMKTYIVKMPIFVEFIQDLGIPIQCLNHDNDGGVCFKTPEFRSLGG
jgi:hypothetical protein